MATSDNGRTASAYEQAVRSPAEIDAAVQQLGRIRDEYHATGSAGLRARKRIVASWERCRALGVDRDPETSHRDDLDERIEANVRLLTAVAPILARLSDALAETGYVVSVSDGDGIILDLCGDHDVWRRVARADFVPGVDMSEVTAGTNAIGTAIADKRPLQLLAAEHFCEGALRFTCTASRIFVPGTREIVGVLNISADYRLVRSDLISLIMEAAFDTEERFVRLR